MAALREKQKSPNLDLGDPENISIMGKSEILILLMVLNQNNITYPNIWRTLLEDVELILDFENTHIDDERRKQAYKQSRSSTDPNERIN